MYIDILLELADFMRKIEKIHLVGKNRYFVEQLPNLLVLLKSQNQIELIKMTSFARIREDIGQKIIILDVFFFFTRRLFIASDETSILL